MSPDEAQILRRLHYEEGHSPAAIAKLLGRHKSSVCRALKAKKGKKPVGKPRALTSDKVDQIEAKLKDLIMKAYYGPRVVGSLNGESALWGGALMGRMSIPAC